MVHDFTYIINAFLETHVYSIIIECNVPNQVREVCNICFIT